MAILVGSADPALRKVIAGVLRFDGLDAIEAVSDEAALAEVARVRFRLSLEAIVLDARRDRKSPMRALAEIRATNTSVRIAVVVRDASLDAMLSCYAALPLVIPLTTATLRAAIGVHAQRTAV